MRVNRLRFMGMAAFACASLVASAAQAQDKKPVAATPAAAKAWSAARDVLPDKVQMVFGVNVAAIKGTNLFKTVYPMLVKQEPDLKEGLDTVQSSCSIDVTTAITQVVVAMADDDNGAIFAQLSGLDEAKVTSCVQALAKKKENKKVTAKSSKSGSATIVEYTAEGEKDKIYVAWIGGDTIAIATEPSDKKLLEKMIAGKGALAKAADFSKAVGRIDTNAAVWGVVLKSQQLSEKGTMKAGYGAIDVVGGNVNVDGHLIMTSAAEAKAMADEVNAEMKANAGSAPPEMAKIIKALKITSNGDDLQFKVSLTEKELLGMAGMFLSGGF